MLAIFFRFFKDKRNSVIIFSCFGVLLLWLYILLFPSMEKLGHDFLKVLENYPAGITDIFPISEASFSSIENFLAIEQYSLMIPMLIIFMLVAMATSALASEIEQGTAEILLARPLSRIKIFISRYLMGISSLIIFIFASTFMIIPLGALHNINYSLINFLSISILCFLFGWAVFSLAMLVSSIFSEKSKVFIVMGSIMIGMYVLQIIASLSDKWNYFQFASFFYYYDYNKALLDQTLNFKNILVFFIVAIVCSIAAGYWFNKRDIAIQ